MKKKSNQQLERIYKINILSFLRSELKERLERIQELKMILQTIEDLTYIKNSFICPYIITEIKNRDNLFINNNEACYIISNKFMKMRNSFRIIIRANVSKKDSERLLIIYDKYVDFIKIIIKNKENEND